MAALAGGLLKGPDGPACNAASALYNLAAHPEPNLRPAMAQPEGPVSVGEKGRVVSVGEKGRVVSVGEKGRVVSVGEKGRVEARRRAASEAAAAVPGGRHSVFVGCTRPHCGSGACRDVRRRAGGAAVFVS